VRLGRAAARPRWRLTAQEKPKVHPPVRRAP
jgi:hypothetical protein